jgi:hypothetical protein
MANLMAAGEPGNSGAALADLRTRLPGIDRLLSRHSA